MKKLFTILTLAASLFSVGAFAQVPNMMNYQGVVRNGSGTPIANQLISLRLSILDQTASGTVLYSETQSPTTNAFGLYSVMIGSGTIVSGSWGAIDWVANSKFLQVEIDPAGGTTYTTVGTPTQMISTPYALASNELLATSSGGGGIRGNGTSSLWLGMYEAGVYRGYLGSYSGKNEDVDIGTGASNALGSMNLCVMAVPKMTIDSLGNVGVGTRFPKYRFQIDGTTGTFADNGIRINNATANSGWSFYSSSGGNLVVGKTSNLGQFDGVTGAYTSSSDSRLKTNVRSMSPVLPALMNLDIKRYEFINNNPTHKQSIGVLAQDLQSRFPELVSVMAANDGNPVVSNQLTVDYAGMSVLAIKAIQEQQVLIQQLQEKIAQLEQQLKNK